MEEPTPGQEHDGRGGWAPLFARYAPLALRLARGIVHHRDQAEDVVQEAMRALLERSADVQRFASPEHARNYFLRAVQNRALEVVRVGERERALAPEAEPQERPEHDRLRALEEHETRSIHAERLRRAVEGLRPAEREVVRLRYLEGLSFREMAELTGASISTLHSRIEAALTRLRARLGPG